MNEDANTTNTEYNKMIILLILLIQNTIRYLYYQYRIQFYSAFKTHVSNNRLEHLAVVWKSYSIQGERTASSSYCS